MPPSIHYSSGGTYTWINGEPTQPLPLVKVEDVVAAIEAVALLDVAEKSSTSEPKTNAESNFEEGERNKSLTSFAGLLRSQGASEATIEAALLEHNRDKCIPPLPDDDVRQIARSVSRYPGKVVLPALTDLGNIVRFVDQHKGTVYKIKQENVWANWTGRRWEKDTPELTYQKGKQTILDIPIEVSYVTGPDQTAVDNLKKAILAHAAASQSIFRINAMLSKAGDEVGMYAMPDEFDKDKYLLNVLNGTIELKTGTFREHNREDKITKIAPIKYEAGAQCDRFKKFLHEIMGGESALIEYWQRLMGLILTGDISEQYLHICYGTGANGKTTLFETLMALLGPDYAKRASSSLLMEKTFGSEANYDLARFPGVRLVLVRETEEGKRLAKRRPRWRLALMG